MNNVAFDKKQWDTFWKVWDRRVETLPGARKAALFQAGRAAEKVLHKQIDSRFDETRVARRNKRWVNVHPREDVKRWQELRLGSFNGYAALSPGKDTVYSGASAKDVTRYLERGHKIRPPSGRWKRYEKNIRINDKFDTNRKHALYHVVAGRMFYSWARMDATRVAIAAAREEILEWIEGFAEGEE